MLRGAIIGVGNVALAGHLPGWIGRDDVLIIGGTDVEVSGRERLLAAVPSARWFHSVDSLLAEENLDFVDICTPPGTHAELALRALHRDLHVLSEKPLTTSVGEFREIAEVARARDRALVTVHNWAHAPLLEKVRRLLDGGAVGGVRSVEWQTLRTGPAAIVGGGENWRLDPQRSGGGILTDHGWHALYLLHHWLGGSARRLRARLEHRRFSVPGLEDTASVELEYPDATASLFLTWSAAERANRCTIEGSDGLLRFDGGVVELRNSGGESQFWQFPPLTEGSQHPDWFSGVIDELLAEISRPELRGSNLLVAGSCSAAIDAARASAAADGEWTALSQISPAVINHA